MATRKHKIVICSIIVISISLHACSLEPDKEIHIQNNNPAQEIKKMNEKEIKSEEKWREQLTPEQFYITRQKGTERAFTGKYWNCDEEGIYKCICCGEPLFDSTAKFNSGCGWPSFYEPVEAKKIATSNDTSHGMVRTEVTCKHCGAHLGHVFPDGPKPSGLRYCINSAALNLEKKNKKVEK